MRRIHGAQLTDHALENFQESLLALEASGASAPERQEMRVTLVREVAGYLLKAAQPEQARAFLLAELGAAAKEASLYPYTFIPAPALRAAPACADIISGCATIRPGLRRRSGTSTESSRLCWRRKPTPVRVSSAPDRPIVP